MNELDLEAGWLIKIDFFEDWKDFDEVDEFSQDTLLNY